MCSKLQGILEMAVIVSVAIYTDPDECSVRAMLQECIENQINFPHVFAGENALIGLVPIKNILLLPALRYFVMIYVKRFSRVHEQSP